MSRTPTSDSTLELTGDNLRLKDAAHILRGELRELALAKGYSGVTTGLLDQLVEMYNRGVVPAIPEQGSVGASGDLAPLAHLALVVMGEGHAFVTKPAGNGTLRAGHKLLS